MSPFRLEFSQMILHTETSKLVYNWSFLFVVLHKPTLLPSTFNRTIDINRSSMANRVLRKLAINRNPLWNRAQYRESSNVQHFFFSTCMKGKYLCFCFSAARICQRMTSIVRRWPSEWWTVASLAASPSWAPAWSGTCHPTSWRRRKTRSPKSRVRNHP